MTVLLTEGFDLYANASSAEVGLLSRWVYDGSTTTNRAMSAGRVGGQALQQGNNTGNRCSHYIDIGSNQASFAVGFAFKYENLAGASLAFSAGTDFVALYDGSTYHIGLFLHSDGRLQVKRSTTVLATTAGAVITTDTWHSIEIIGTIDDAAGAVSVYVDNVQVINISGVDTRNAGNAYINRVQLLCPDGSGSNGVSHHDDFYVASTTTRIGECRIKTIRPNADTVEKDFARSAGSDNFALVNETVVDGDTTYVEASTSGDLDLYELGDLGVASATIHCVQPIIFAKKTDVAARSLHIPIKSGGTQSDGAATALLTTYDHISRPMAVNPVTTAAWTLSEVDALQAGLKVA